MTAALAAPAYALEYSIAAPDDYDFGRNTSIEVIHTADEVLASLRRVMADPSIGIVLMTEKLINTCPNIIYRYKLTQKRPLIVEVPDRHGEGDVSQTIEKYVSEAIGIKL